MTPGKKILHVFPILSLWQIMTPPGQGSYESQGHSKEDHYIHCYTQNMKVLGLLVSQKKNFLFVLL